MTRRSAWTCCSDVSDDHPAAGARRFAGAKKIVPASAGTFPVSGFTFVVLLVGTVILVGALTFLPALALGPIVEHFLMLKGNLF